MKHFYLLLLLLSTLSSVAATMYTQPSPIFVCAGDVPGFGIFDLTARNTEILDGADPALNPIRFYLTLSDAGNNLNEILPQTAFTNTIANNQVVFVRVDDTVNSMMSIMQLELVVLPLPTATVTGVPVVCAGDPGSVVFTGQNGIPPYTFSYSIDGIGPYTVVGNESVGIVIPTFSPGAFTVTLHSVTDSSSENCIANLSQDFSFMVVAPPVIVQPPTMLIVENPFDGFATFDLTQQEPIIANNVPGYSISYFLSQMDAVSNANEIASPASFTNFTNPQTIWVSVQETSQGCSVVTSFQLVVSNDDMINMPDPALKNILLSAGLSFHVTGINNLPVVVDVNGDNEIQLSEALLVYRLYGYDMNISNLEGLQYFTNLRDINIGENEVSSFDFSPLVNLESLNIQNNNFTQLDLSAVPTLKQLLAGENGFTSLDLTNCPLLQDLTCEENNLTTLNVAGLTNLSILHCSSNSISVLDLSSATELHSLVCSNNEISVLDVGGATGMEQLICGSNNITTLDLTNLTQLGILWVDYLPLTTIDISTSENLSSFSGWLMPLLTTLDASNNPNLCYIFTVSGPNLQSVNMKNGATCMQNNLNFLNSPNLEYVCVDEANILTLVNYFATNNMPNVNVNTYCTFTPGGDYNSIVGTVQFDADANGCDASDATVNNVKINISQGVSVFSNFTYDAGNYSLFAQTGSYTVAPILENPSYFTVSPASLTIDFPNVNGTVQNQDFCLSPNGIHSDVEIAMAPLTAAVPGFDVTYQVVIKNKGNQTEQGIVTVDYDNAVVDFISSNLPTVLQGNSVEWSFANLQPFESRTLELVFNVNSPVETPPVNLDDILEFDAVVSISNNTDEFLDDNSVEFHQTVVGAFDPNDKICSQGDLVSTIMIGEYLHYIINFENTGNYPAQNIVVRDIIDITDYDVNSLQILTSSHPVVARLSGNNAEFIFENIQLESGGHGNILMKIKTLPSLMVGGTVSNKADIFFDYNAPVITDFANTQFQSLSVKENQLDQSISIYPNPAIDQIHIAAKSTIKSVELYDIQGRLLQTMLTDAFKVTLPIDHTRGVYLLKVTSEDGVKTEKLLIK